MKFKSGFEGPSISYYTDFSKVNSEVVKIANLANIDLSKGKIIADDLTYEALKNYPNTMPITYLRLSGVNAKLSAKEVVNIIEANGIITRCSSLDGWDHYIHPIKLDSLCAIKIKR
jgi:hypothetical protein